MTFGTMRNSVSFRLALSLCALVMFMPSGWCTAKPKVRAITAFVRLERTQFESQFHDALVVLRRAKAEFEKAGYEVQTLRISTQPFPEYIRGSTREEALAFFRRYDATAQKEGFISAIGPAMVGDSDDPHNAELLGEILMSTRNLDATLIVAADDGIHWKGVHAAAGLVKFLSERTPHSQGAFHFAAAAMVSPDTPFYPVSYHLGTARAFGVALQSANVVAEVFESAGNPEKARDTLARVLGGHAKSMEAIARKIEQETRWDYAGLDLSPAPLKEVSIGAAIESLTHAKVGSSGTLTAAAAITAALRDISVKGAGYSGLMLPVLEDSVLAERWSEGSLRLDSLLAYSAVCGTGLDVVPLPGEISEEQLGRIIGDVASLAFKLHKPLSARLLPVAGKKAGERTEFVDPFLVNATLQPLP